MRAVIRYTHPARLDAPVECEAEILTSDKRPKWGKVYFVRLDDGTTTWVTAANVLKTL